MHKVLRRFVPLLVVRFVVSFLDRVNVGFAALVTGEYNFYTVRILLGAADAGFFPSVLLFLIFWVPSTYCGRVVAAFMAAMLFANVFGSPSSGLLLSIDSLFGIHGGSCCSLSGQCPRWCWPWPC